MMMLSYLQENCSAASFTDWKKMQKKFLLPLL